MPENADAQNDQAPTPTPAPEPTPAPTPDPQADAAAAKKAEQDAAAAAAEKQAQADAAAAAVAKKREADLAAQAAEQAKAEALMAAQNQAMQDAKNRRPGDPVKVRCLGITLSEGHVGPVPTKLSFKWRHKTYSIPANGVQEDTMPREAAEFLLQKAGRYWSLKAKLVIVEPKWA